jgi:uncharacterized protein
MWIGRLARLPLPRPDPFFSLLGQIGCKMTDGGGGHLRRSGGRHRARGVERGRRPVQPDRDDLARLTKALDVVDGMEHAAAFAVQFLFHALTEPMRRMVHITTRAVDVLSQAVANLGNLTDNDPISKSAVALHILENEADGVCRAAVEDLFAAGHDTRERGAAEEHALLA